MSERLPYEEQLVRQLDDLPLPDENAAWADMKRRLDEDDNDGIVPFWLRGCAGWGLLLLVLGGLGWWWLQPQKWFRSKQRTEAVKEIGDKRSPVDKEADHKMTDSPQYRKDRILGNDTVKMVSGRDRLDSAHSEIILTTSPGSGGKKTTSGKPKSLSEKEIKRKTTPTQQVKNKNPEKDVDEAGITVDGPPVLSKTTKQADTVRKNFLNDSEIVIETANKNKDTAQKVIRDTLIKKTPAPQVKTNEQKKDSSKPKIFYWSAGLAMQQQIALDSQKAVPYNSLGRKGTLGDYIPSIFVRFNKKNKWFLQAEFKYGAPQYTPEFLFSKKIDTIINPQKIRFTSTRVVKTYYHQLPLTFHYFILPGWSVGGGVVWNRFQSAVITKDIIDHNNLTGIDTAVSLGIIQRIRKPDSNFVKSYFQGVVESQVKWKRFSLGARYAFGLQPYIKFILPGGTQQQEKNMSLQIFLRYELWKSKEKTKR